MKVTKFVHSCLLVEDEEKTVLIDPGIFSWNSGLINLDSMPSLDVVLITHLHPDHCHPDFIRALQNRFANVPIVSNDDVAESLKSENIKVDNGIYDFVEHETIKHAGLWFGLFTPQNTVFTVFDRLTHAGDSHDLETTSEILALPITAPWGSFKDAMELIKKLAPKKLIPIHDWWLSEQGKKWYYDRAKVELETIGVEFIPIEDDITIEL